MIHQEYARERAKAPRFAFVGRLVPEKGFSDIISLAEHIASHPGGGTLEICGDGIMREEMIARLQKLPGFYDGTKEGGWSAGASVVYYGNVSGEKVRQILQNVHYLLMPSRFLETFGLSALESIESGVPVIAPNKGGLRQFLLSEHAIEGQNGAQESQAFLRKVQEIQNRFSGSDWKRQSNTARDIAARFSQAAWLENALSFIPAGSRILFVTDYGAPLGGIESWISGSRKLLEMANCTTDCIASTNTSTTWMRQIHLLFSTANWWFAWRLARKIRTYKPDYIWLWSILRSIGPVWLRPIQSFEGKTLITYHDLGFFAARATDMEFESQIPQDLRWDTYISWVQKCTLLRLPGLLWKFFHLRRIQKVLARVERHFVPSAFMKVPVEHLYAQGSPTIVFPHCNPHILDISC